MTYTSYAIVAIYGLKFKKGTHTFHDVCDPLIPDHSNWGDLADEVPYDTDMGDGIILRDTSEWRMKEACIGFGFNPVGFPGPRECNIFARFNDPNSVGDFVQPFLPDITEDMTLQMDRQGAEFWVMGDEATLTTLWSRTIQRDDINPPYSKEKFKYHGPFYTEDLLSLTSRNQ